ncbi:tRNA lysidine(34) synthetase TilS [Lactococcus nasutitermitis]|uniref:tRNA(Ile)-lysidine synthase n=1 Tax=Lactococcus nasutitermitis TaxID=1652957 RepID=A0ABV9JAF0_9LACT|nr:tRNA lysidine(34) synthetase TilS [Lactococcus nasutitermitis]
MTNSERKFLKIIKEKAYFSVHKKVLVALSGGVDSMTLFNWLYDLQAELDIELGIAHINHGLREASEMEERELRKLAQKLSVAIYVDKFTGKFTEENARHFRYDFFEKTMKENGYTALVTAHHKGDIVETVLMREITGRPLRSLQGIKDCQPFAHGELIRPLLQFEKSEFDAPFFFEDITNQGTDYLRNRIRNQIIPELSQENPQFTKAILSLSNEVSLAMSAISENISELNILSDKINLDKFLQQSPALQHFILQEYLTYFPDLALTKATFNELLHIVSRPQQYHSSLSKDYDFVKNDKFIYIIEQKHEKKDELEILYENPHDDSFLEVNLPINGKLEIRKRQSGDTIIINGHHKKLRKYFIENHVPLEKRENFLIFVDKELYAIADLACSDLSKRIKSDKMKRTLWVKPVVREDNKNA